MLRSFRLANHKSIRTEQEILLMPAYEKTRPVVPVAAVYGANASGKSNLLDALRFMQFAVRASFGRWEAETGVPRTPFRLDVEALAEPSSYAVDLIIDGVQYMYGFNLDDVRVVDEWLYAYHHSNRKTIIFERSDQDVTLGDSLPERRSRTKALAGALRDNALLLSAAMQLGEQPEFAPVYRWFRTGLIIPRPDLQIRRYLPDRVKSALAHHPAFIDLIRSADVDIVDVRVDEIEESVSPARRSDADRLAQEIRHLREQLEVAPEDAQGALKNRLRLLEARRRHLGAPQIRRELIFLQGPSATPMTAEDQSSGTLAYVDLMADALDALSRGAVLLVDEIDMSLHPRLTARLIELFQDPSVNLLSAQLVFTTHDATLLGTSFGKEILRRDEIWFVEKREGVSSFYPLSDFHPRQGENRERRYLGGSYGGVPAVFEDTLVESLLESRSEAADGAS